MLFTDTDGITASDLQQLDSEVLPVSATAKIPIALDGPGSVCENTWRECGQKITAAQQLYSTYLAQPGMTSGHLAAVLNVGIPARTQPRVRLNQIVLNDSQYGNSRSALQAWMGYEALALFYRDMAGRLNEDRYEKKMERYEQYARRHWNELRAAGLPMVYQPMEAPGARHSYNAGSWSSANVTGSSAPGLLGGNVLVAITWYDASKYQSPANPGNAESAPSALVNFAIPSGQALTVSIAGLNPPTGAADPVGTSTGTWLPLNATHWNIYAGQEADGAPLYLQQEGIPIGTTSFTLTADPVFSGNILQQGQYPDLNIVFQNLVMRG